jgi:hypothetical protein
VQFSEEQLDALEQSETEGAPWISLYVFPYPDEKKKLCEYFEYFDDLIILGCLIMLRLNFTSLPPPPAPKKSIQTLSHTNPHSW